MLGFPLKSSRHPAGALPVFEGVAGNDPPSAEADGRNDALFQHRVDRQTTEVQTVGDLFNCHPCPRIKAQPAFVFQLDGIAAQRSDSIGRKVRADSHGRVAWDTHNEVRLAVARCLVDSLNTIYAEWRAKCPVAENKTLERFDWNFTPKTFDRVQLEALATGDFIGRQSCHSGLEWDWEKSCDSGARSEGLRTRLSRALPNLGAVTRRPDEPRGIDM